MLSFEQGGSVDGHSISIARHVEPEAPTATPADVRKDDVPHGIPSIGNPTSEFSLPFRREFLHLFMNLFSLRFFLFHQVTEHKGEWRLLAAPLLSALCTPGMVMNWVESPLCACPVAADLCRTAGFPRLISAARLQRRAWLPKRIRVKIHCSCFAG